MAQLMPIFPLEVALLPGLPLPLHIFEPRYRQLVADISADGAERAFGVVALHTGREVYEPDQRESMLAAVGTVAEIIEIEPYADGRSDLLAIGSRRFRVRSLDHAKPYLRARVEWLDERDGDLGPGVVGTAASLCERYIGTLGALARGGRTLGSGSSADSGDADSGDADDSGSAEHDPLASDPVLLSYQIAAHLRLPNSERQQLLEAATAADRLRAALRLLRREITLLSHTRSVPVPARALQVDASSN